MKPPTPKPRRVPCDWIGLAKLPGSVGQRRPVSRLYWSDYPAEVELEPGAPLAPAASEVFSPEELAARLEYYAARAEAGLPLFADGKPVSQTKGERMECWGCGRPTPPNPDGRLRRLSPRCAPGWVVETPMHKSDKKRVSVWCPECFAMGGFGCVEEPEPQDHRVSPTLKRA